MTHKELDEDKRLEEVFHGLKTEIGASKVLLIRNERDRVWNSALDKALKLVRQYEAGNGLFQSRQRLKPDGD